MHYICNFRKLRIILITRRCFSFAGVNKALFLCEELLWFRRDNWINWR